MRKHTYFEAYLDDFDKIVVYFSKESYGGISNRFYLKDHDGYLQELSIQSVEQSGNNYNKYTLSVPSDIHIGTEYDVVHQFARTAVLEYAYITKTARFDECFTYEGDDLGFQYTKEKTDFALWAPTAAKVKLEITRHDQAQTYEMKRTDHGVYRCSLMEDLDGASYLYIVRVNGEWKECIDPYGIASDTNARHSVIVDRSRIPKVSPINTSLHSVCDAIIYETSVRDFTMQEGIGITYPGKFKGFYEENKETTEKQTGFAYLKSLGITHVQLMPVTDFGSVDEEHPELFYNWGYDPVQWGTLEGSYGSDIQDPYSRMREFAQLINKCHEHNIRVNLDMVFNHVYDMTSNALNISVPYYYFQMNETGHFSNGSFCGNDLDTKRTMCRKLILHMCRFLCEMYGIDGMRLDLMGILDMDTVNEIRWIGQKINPDFMVYGEGWDMPSFLPREERASIPNNAAMPYIAHFSDRFRDVVKGKTSDHEVGVKGYCSGDTNLIDVMKNVMLGSCNTIGCERMFEHPRNVVNYVECHDNMTCWDKLKECCKEDPREIRIQRHTMCIAAVLLAQGIPFLHSGQEFARTKHGKGNTYNDSDDINKLDYQRKERYHEMVEHTKALIRIRKAHAGFRYESAAMIHRHVEVSDIDRKVLVYEIHDEKEDLIVFFNPTMESFTYHLPAAYELLFYNGPVSNERYEELSIMGISTIVMTHQKTGN